MSRLKVSFYVCTTTTLRNSFSVLHKWKVLEVQKKLRRNSYCYLTLLHVDESLQTYKVSKDVRVGDGRKDITYMVCSKNEHAFKMCVACSNLEGTASRTCYSHIEDRWRGCEEEAHLYYDAFI